MVKYENLIMGEQRMWKYYYIGSKNVRITYNIMGNVKLKCYYIRIKIVRTVTDVSIEIKLFYLWITVKYHYIHIKNVSIPIIP